MDAQALDTHKKVLGIIYVIIASLTILSMLFVRALMGIILGFAFEGGSDEEEQIANFVMMLMSFVPALIIIFFAIPTLVAGIGLLARQSWGMIFGMVVGCLQLIWFPIGTAIGIYAIWIFTEDQRFKKLQRAQ